VDTRVCRYSSTYLRTASDTVLIRPSISKSKR